MRGSVRGPCGFDAWVSEPLVDAACAVGGVYFAGGMGLDKFDQHGRGDREGGFLAWVPVGVITWLKAPGVPDGPVGFEGALGVGRVGGEALAYVALDFGGGLRRGLRMALARLLTLAGLSSGDGRMR